MLDKEILFFSHPRGYRILPKKISVMLAPGLKAYFTSIDLSFFSKGAALVTWPTIFTTQASVAAEAKFHTGLVYYPQTTKPRKPM
jgi:hypothetical protein